MPNTQTPHTTGQRFWQGVRQSARSGGLVSYESEPIQPVGGWGQNVMTSGIQGILEQHWAASASGDVVAEHDIYDENVLCEYPQSGERIRGRRNLQGLRGHHPGKPSGFDVRRIVGEGELWVTEYAINYEGKIFQTVSIMQFRNEKVVHETQYFAEPFEAPAWRIPWVEHAA